MTDKAFETGVRDGMAKMATTTTQFLRDQISSGRLNKALLGSAVTGAVALAYGVGRRHGTVKAEKSNRRISDWMDSNGKHVPIEVINGSSKTASEIPDRVIAAAITGAFLGGALANNPEDRRKYMLGGALAGGFLSHRRMQSELRRGFAQVVS